MNEFEQLKDAAAKRRDLDLEKINREYRYSLLAIRALERSFRVRQPREPRTNTERKIRPVDPDSPYRLMTTIQAANAVLNEGKPMTTVELAIEIMDRGHRSFDTPRAVLKVLRASLDYHKAKFRQDAEGRWRLVP